MAGLPTKSDTALQQWHHLFESRGELRSMQAQQHWQQLMRLGLPTRKHENWKYTPLDGLLAQHFVLPESQDVSASQVEALALPLDAIRLVFVDGKFQSALSATGTDFSRFSTALPLSVAICLRRFSQKSFCI